MKRSTPITETFRISWLKGGSVAAASKMVQDRFQVEGLVVTVPVQALQEAGVIRRRSHSRRADGPGSRRNLRLGRLARVQRLLEHSQSGYSSLRQERGSAGWAFGVRSSR